MFKENYSHAWWVTKESQIKYGLREGYHEAALRLIKSLENERSLKSKDTLIFPILFLHTHSLELLLKELIQALDFTKKNLIEHNLLKLYDEARIKLEEFFLIYQIDDSELKRGLKNMYEEIKVFQDGSISNRYLSKFSKKKNKELLIYDEELIVDYKLLNRKVEETYSFLDSLLDFIEVHKQNDDSDFDL